MGAGIGNAAPFLLGAAGAGAGGLIQGRRQADEHAQLMQMLAMQQARENREQGLYPGQLAEQSARTSLMQEQSDYAQKSEPYRLQTEQGNARAVNEPFATPSNPYLSALTQALPKPMQGLDLSGLNNQEINRVVGTGLQTNEQNVQASRVQALARQALGDKLTRDIISKHTLNQNAYEKALHDQSAYEQSLLSPGQGVTKDPAEITADRQRLQAQVNITKAARDASELEMSKALDTFMQQQQMGVGGVIQQSGQPGYMSGGVGTSAPPPFIPRKYTVSPDQ